jgi:hypothetical protein
MSNHCNPIVINQVGNSKIPPSGHPFFSTNISNENKTRENSKKSGQERVIVPR